MPADEHLSEIQFEYASSDESEWGGAKGVHRIRAVHDVPLRTGGTTQVQVGTLTWASEGIRNIDVDPEHRRRGVATAMWNEAHRLAGEVRRIPKPKHSKDRTTKGDAWARAVGGPLPRNTIERM